MIATPGLSVNFLKKENYTGSHAGTRYYLCAKEELLYACVYPEPWCFEATPEEDKQWKEFDFSSEGLKEAVQWIDNMAAQKKE